MNSLKTIFMVTALSLLFVTSGCSTFTGSGDDDSVDMNNNDIQAPAFGDLEGIETQNDIPTAWTEPGEDANELTTDGDNDWKRLPEVKLPSIYFSYDKDLIGTSEKNKLDQIANYLKNNSVLGLIIEGNCDERGSQEYNRALGERRALNVKNYLMSCGVADERLRTISYGEDNPAVTGDNENIWRQNRRADLVIAKMNK
jgi:peptidoglycan-associated lipoprotein